MIVLIFYSSQLDSKEGVTYEINSDCVEEVFVERIFLVSKKGQTQNGTEKYGEKLSFIAGAYDLRKELGSKVAAPNIWAAHFFDLRVGQYGSFFSLRTQDFRQHPPIHTLLSPILS